MSTLDLFGDPKTLRASFWLYASTNGVVALGKTHHSVESAQEVLLAYSKLDLHFRSDRLTADEAYKKKINVAVVVDEEADVVAWAEMPSDWFPPKHPRHR